mgnify:CR=1 FL=1
MTDSVHVLGISAFYHDAAAALLTDGEIVAASQEERFTRKKHDPRFPVNAIQYCLEAGEIDPDELKAVVFYDNPALSFDRIVRTFVSAGESGKPSWMSAAPGWLSSKMFAEQLVREELQCDVPVLFSEHHFSHAASAFYPSPYQEAAVLTIDGVGEWATTTLGVGEGSDLQILKEIYFPDSLGLLYSAFTQYTGFRVNTGEYKLMGLAPYGNPIYANKIREHLIDVKEDGSFKLNLEYFGFTNSEHMTNAAFAELFGGEARPAESRLSQREMDLAASVQLVTEEVVLKLCRHVREITGKKNLCMAGGVALNCVANGKILQAEIFDNLWVQPAAGDAGCAIGAAAMVTHNYFGIDRQEANNVDDRQRGSYLGIRYSNAEIKAFLDHNKLPYEQVSDEDRAKIVGKALADQKIVGYMVGHAEFGPRSLGARSILGDARSAETQSQMNLKVKFRESFRPFAPCVLKHMSQDYFDLDHVSPYMLIVAPVKEEIRTPTSRAEGDDMITIVNQARSTIPAVTHVDYSARVQTVDGKYKQDYFDLMAEFEKLTGVGVIVNTSFNVRSEPIVGSPSDSYICFMRTGMDVLVMENFILVKSEQPEFKEQGDWRDQYELD